MVQKILHVLGNFETNRGGAQKIAYDVIMGSVNQQQLLVLFGDGNLANDFKHKIDTIILNSSKINLMYLIYRIRKTIKQFKANIVHVHSPAVHFLCRLAIIGLGSVRLVVTVHNTKFNRIIEIQEKFLLPKANKVIASSSEVFKYANHLTNRAKNVVIVRNGINEVQLTETYARAVSYTAKKLFPKRYDEYGDDLVIFGFVGRLVEQKNVDLLITEFSKAYNTTKNVVLLIVGDGVEREKLKNAVKTCNLNVDSVVFTGYSTEVPAYMKTIDVFCMTSKWEGMSIALLEAMFAAKSVITTNLPIFHEVLGDCGVIVNEQEIHDAMIKMANNRDFRVHNASLMKLRVEEHFTSKKMVREYDAIYEEFLFNA